MERVGLSTTIRSGGPVDLDPDDLEQSDRRARHHGNVAGGITIEGIGVENDIDDDGDWRDRRH